MTSGGVLRGLAAVLACALLLGAGTAAAASAPALAASAQPPDPVAGLELAPQGDRPPPGYRRSPAAVIRAAVAIPAVRRARAAHRPSYARAYLEGPGRWRVAVYVPPGGPDVPSEEIARVGVDDRTGRVLEAWTGPQVQWPMARGTPGQFGRAVNSPWIWIGLCVAFVAPFARRPLRALHADLAVLLAFSIPYAFVGAADLDVAIPAVYPLLVYLAARMAWIGVRGPPRAPATRGSDTALLAGLGFLLAFRVVLNVVDGNVIDVGYAGVIGADRLLHGEPLYGGFPAANAHGDTYGPVAYLAYVPWVALWPWSGGWDDLPAAHAAAVAFDFACLAGLWLAGRRVGGPRLGILLAYAWTACPWTLLVMNSGANDALPAALALAAVLCIGRPAARGALVALAGLAKFAPLGLLPLLVLRGRGRARAAAAAALTGVLLLAPVALAPGGLAFAWERTLGFQAERSSPFSLWGLYGGLDAVQTGVTLAAAALALVFAVLPGPSDAATVAARGAAVLLALQLAVTHWFFLYLVWFLPLLLLAELGGGVRGQPGSGRSTGSIAAARRPVPQRIRTALIHGSSSEGS